MAKLRRASTYRRLKRPYTRISKYKKHSFIRGVPGNKVVKYDVGDTSRSYPVSVTICSKKTMNLRHNAIEAGRVAANKHLETVLGKNAYHLKVRVVPHHVMRENPLATGAGADRFQTGMTRSFGKPIGRAARLFEGKAIMTVFCEKDHIAAAKEALRKASSKYPMGVLTEVVFK